MGKVLLVLFGVIFFGQACYAQKNNDLFEKIFGRKKNTGSQVINAPLFIDEQEIGPVDLRLVNSQLDAIAIQLLPYLEDYLLDSTLEKLKLMATQDAWLKHSELIELGVTAEYKASAIELVLNLASEVRKPISLAISQSQNSVLRQHSIRPAKFSAYGNLGFSSLINRHASNQYGLTWAGALNWKGRVLEYQADALWSGQLSTFRGPLTVVQDRLENKQRLRFGDQISAGSPLLAGRQIAGFGLYREDALEPANPPYPGLERRLDISAPTQLETRINGQFIGRRFLQPGRYDLTDFPLSFGESDVELILHGLDGSVQTIDERLIRTPELLGQGLDRYALSFGFERDFTAGPWAYRSDRWVFSSSYQRGFPGGLSTRFSLDARGEADSLFVGSGLSYGLPFALAQLDGIVTRTQVQCCASAWAASLSSYPARAGHWPIEWSLRGSYAQRHFGQSSPSEQGRWQADSELQWLLAASLRTGASLSLSQDGDGLINRRASLSFNYQPSRQWLTRFSLNHRRRNGQAGEWGISIALRFQWTQAGVSLGAQHNGLDHRSEFNAQYGQYRQRGGYATDFYYSRDPDAQRYEAYLSLDSNRAAADVGVTHTRPTNQEQSSANSLSFSTRSAWVLADGHWGITRQVNDSFALFSPPADLAATEVLIGAYDDDYQASSGRLGPAVIGNLRAYEERSFGLSLPNYPLNRDPGELLPQIRPSYRSGVLVPVGGAPVFIIRLAIHDQTDQVLALQALALRDGGGELAHRSFSNKRGEAVFAGVTVGEYALIFKEQVVRRFSVSPEHADKNYLIQLGTLNVGTKP